MKLTPIYLTFDNFYFPNRPPILEPISSAEVSEDIVLGNSRFFLEISSPSTPQNPGLIPQVNQKFYVGSSPNYNQKLRLSLNPSFGYGIQSCYQVDYYEWRRPVLPSTLNQPVSIYKKKLRTEYWHVPTLENIHLDDYESYCQYVERIERYPDFISGNREETATLTWQPQTTLNSLIESPEIIDIKEIKSGGILIEGWEIEDTSAYWVPAPVDKFEPFPFLIQINWTNSTLDLNAIDPVDLEITYYQNAHLEDLVFTPHIGNHWYWRRKENFYNYQGGYC